MKKISEYRAQQNFLIRFTLLIGYVSAIVLERLEPALASILLAVLAILVVVLTFVDLARTETNDKISDS